MIIEVDDIIWESQDATGLREFFSSTTGQRFLALMAYGCPEFGDGVNGNKTLVLAGRVEGYQLAVSKMVRAQFEHPKEVRIPEAYPSLDNDAAWEENPPVDNSKKS